MVSSPKKADVDSSLSIKKFSYPPFLIKTPGDFATTITTIDFNILFFVSLNTITITKKARERQALVFFTQSKLFSLVFQYCQKSFKEQAKILFLPLINPPPMITFQEFFQTPTPNNVDPLPNYY